MSFYHEIRGNLGLAGPDKGKGAKYLIVGPGQSAPQAEGFIVVHSSTLNVMMGFRNLETDPEKADRLLKQYRVYPYAQRNNHRSLATSRLTTRNGAEANRAGWAIGNAWRRSSIASR